MYLGHLQIQNPYDWILVAQEQRWERSVDFSPACWLQRGNWGPTVGKRESLIHQAFLILLGILKIFKDSLNGSTTEDYLPGREHLLHLWYPISGPLVWTILILTIGMLSVKVLECAIQVRLTQIFFSKTESPKVHLIIISNKMVSSLPCFVGHPSSIFL